MSPKVVLLNKNNSSCSGIVPCLICQFCCKSTPWEVLAGCSSPLLRPWARRWINHSSLWCMASAMPDLRLPVQSQDIAALDWYQIILLGDRGTCVCVNKFTATLMKLHSVKVSPVTIIGLAAIWERRLWLLWGGLLWWMAGHYWLGWEWSWCIIYFRRRRRASVSEEAQLQSDCPRSSGPCCVTILSIVMLVIDSV